jgi:inosine-uridine nucleoside N-ribohydrolase
MARKLILDVDTGTDDAVAIMLAALHPDLDLIGVTTVAGNVDVAACTDNSLRTLDFIGRPDIGVHEGLAGPLVRATPPGLRAQAAGVHGGALDVPPASSRKRDRHAVEFLIETYRAATEEIVLVPTGPLSNIAACVALDPKFAARVPEVVLMGGAHHHGNVTASAEFNIWADPDAAAAVLAAGFRRLVMVPLDATHEALVSRAACDALAALGTPAGIAASRFIGLRIAGYDASQRMTEAQSAPVHDALCVAYLVQPDIIETRHVHVAVETQGLLTTGRTVVDINRRGGQAPNCHFAFHADRQRFCDLLLRSFARTV